jgi:transposase
LLKKATLNLGDPMDLEWRIFAPLLPDRRERARRMKNTRRTVNGIVWGIREGASSRYMPKRHGNWNADFAPFARWSKVRMWDARGWLWAARPISASRFTGQNWRKR